VFRFRDYGDREREILIGVADPCFESLERQVGYWTQSFFFGMKRTGNCNSRFVPVEVRSRTRFNADSLEQWNNYEMKHAPRRPGGYI
jgi:hypothetical protein